MSSSASPGTHLVVVGKSDIYLVYGIPAPSKPAFSVRIVVCDHYLTKPVPGVDVIYSEFRGSDIKQVPVLRIFGSSKDGYKVCLHVHGVFPYFYLPCPTQSPEPQFLYQLAASLDKALNIALKQATSSNQHVYKVSLVKGLPFYGYHDKEHLFLKVFLYNPNLIKHAVDLCSNGAILGQVFQPHESHLNFTLQFFIDFNLFGMSNIDLQDVTFRKSGISQNSDDPFENSDFLKSESVCHYEADCAASHIINRQRIGRGDGIENPGLEEVWNQERQRRQQMNMSMASKSLTQGRLRTEETDSHFVFQQKILLKLSDDIDKPVEVSNGSGGSNNDLLYPAESLEGSQLFKAADISVHEPDNRSMSFNNTLKRDLDNTLTEDCDTTFVDETIALNASVQYSQVLLDNEDMDLLELLKDLDEKPIDTDSVMGTPASVVEANNDDSDEAEYSQIFNEESLVLDAHESKDDTEDMSPGWNDSFWDGASIPQLDGTCDDEHVKKVRKRKMRPFKLGLSRPKSNKNAATVIKEEPDSNIDISIPDEINVSRETLDSFSSLHLKSIKKDTEGMDNTEVKPSSQGITELVNQQNKNYETNCESVAKTYDIKNNLQPIAGPSNLTSVKTDSICDIDNDSSSPDSDLGFMSFYNVSKVFDVSLEENNESVIETIKSSKFCENVITAKKEIILDPDEEDIKLYYSETPLVSKSNVNHNKPTILTPKFRPPTKSYIASTLSKYNIPENVSVKPYYSDPKDVGDKIVLGQLLLKLQSKAAQDQPPFEKFSNMTDLEEWRYLMFLQNNETDESTKPDNLKAVLAGNKQCVLEPIKRPPTTKDVVKWIESRTENIADDKPREHDKTIIIDDLDNSQALGLAEVDATLKDTNDKESKDKSLPEASLQVSMQGDGSFLCFGEVEKENVDDASVVEINYLTVMVLEVHTRVRGDLYPDPAVDSIEAVFITVTNDFPSDHRPKKITEIYAIDNAGGLPKFHRCIFQKVTYVTTELELFTKIIESVRNHDPDIICGYEIEQSSWGYVLERSQVLGLEMVRELSRVTERHRQKKWRTEVTDFEGKIIGRVSFNVWRLLRHELALSSYSFENCMYEVLKERVPSYTYASLSGWWDHESRMLRWIPVEYYLTKLSGTVRMLDKLDIINRTAELARLFGLQWWEVLSRGSQFRVESLMLRAARPLNLVALSPGVKQRAAMRAPECLPLILEPESRYYADPVIVLDFQSLYPSMMIAYNYCFSTCIGRVQNINGDAPYEFGAWRLRLPKAKLQHLIDHDLVHWSPAGVGFVRRAERRGVLPALLTRILAARQAVKKSMKVQTDEAVKRAMHSRQLGLKLIANVTYGYTAANFSGRMPCSEVGDSVVAKGRETLERAAALVQRGDWPVRVVYGDTDSLFLLAPGASRRQAFLIGQEVAAAVTADNPPPVALKLEKVYQPCILQTKKRYVGHMYESAEQTRPVLEAKGIETVRRDGCPAGVKLLHTALSTLFTTGDMSLVKREVQATLARLAAGAVPTLDLLFTREYHGPSGYKPGASAPANEIVKRMTAVDPRRRPPAGWRVHWLVTAGAPGPLCRAARDPRALRARPAPALLGYYAARALLPPLARCLALLGADVFQWYRELPPPPPMRARSALGRYLRRGRCGACGARGPALCAACGAAPALPVRRRLRAAEAELAACWELCRACAGRGAEACDGAECPALWRREAAARALLDARELALLLPGELAEDVMG